MSYQNLVDSLKKELAGWEADVEKSAVGEVTEVGDGIVRISGLKDAMASEMLAIKSTGGETIFGVALNLEEHSIGAIILGDFAKIAEGDTVKRTERVLSVPVGEAMVGRVVNALGEPLDGRGAIKSQTFYPVEKIAPGVITRQSVHQPLETGVKVIDSIIPIGRGQRELIIGDRQTGKTALVIDTILNQQGKGVICVYVAIGQKESKVAKTMAILQQRGALEYTTIVLAGASDTAAAAYIAPYTGTAIAEYFMDKGQDVLVVYDDLSKHAVAYRQISLLLKRPPGREAYPGDVFYLHSRLLERAAKLNKDAGGGSLTALPIIETQAGDISAYIPTNVISITDGQIFLETDLFYKGVRPALNAGLSVSRVGSAAQSKAMKKVAGKLKLDLAQYRGLEAFAQFGSDLDEATKQQLARGARITEALKQSQYMPLSQAKQIAIIYAINNGFTDTIPVDKIREFEAKLHEYLDLSGQEYVTAIAETGELSSAAEENLKQVIAKVVATDFADQGETKQN
ncbi:MAG: F0F1 ATP synthase subunit alpha [Candidatus Komeilibacteria bacterium]|nr:F0F1 ATP synthase subunit alpha [Candidatus Komeilibacteria bacterium]